MNGKRIALALAGTLITGAAVYAGDQYMAANDGTAAEVPEIAAGKDLQLQAALTDCGLSNGASAATAGATSAVISDDATRARVVASRLIESGASSKERIAAGDCRYRLDGVWVEDLTLSLDQSETPDGYIGPGGGGGDPTLTHGTYLTPRVLLINASDDGATLKIRNATDDQPAIEAIATDDTPMEEVFRPSGALKAYRVPNWQGASGDDTLQVDVTRNGRVRVRIAGVNFYRAEPTVSQAADLSALDVFMIGFNLDNLAASRKGYDVYTQDAFQLNLNPKAEVFAAADPTQYAIVEKRTVPLGFKLVPEGAQGTIIQSTMIRTEREMQKAVAVSFGMEASADFEVVSASVGGSYTHAQTEGMRNGSARSIAMGFARHKLYALVLDQPFVRLSPEFVDAVEDARRHGRYDELITKFGTHYPYAVTYGSAARMAAEFSEETVTRWNAESDDVNAHAAGAIMGFGASVSGGVYTEQRRQDSSLNQAEKTDFRAVGGTGSYSAESHGTNTPYPIFVDLRPLYQLLNPLNFPDEPEIYTGVREKLKQAEIAYLAQHGQELSDAIPETELQFAVNAVSLRCDRPRKGLVWPDNDSRIDLLGSLSLEGDDPSGRLKLGRQNYGGWNWDSRVTIDCVGGAKGTLPLPARTFTVNGKRSQLRNVRFHYALDLQRSRVTPIRATLALASGRRDAFTMPVDRLDIGASASFTTVLADTDDKPKVVVVSTVKRLR